MFYLYVCAECLIYYKLLSSKDHGCSAAANVPRDSRHVYQHSRLAASATLTARYCCSNSQPVPPASSLYRPSQRLQFGGPCHVPLCLCCYFCKESRNIPIALYLPQRLHLPPARTRILLPVLEEFPCEICSDGTAQLSVLTRAHEPDSSYLQVAQLRKPLRAAL